MFNIIVSTKRVFFFNFDQGGGGGYNLAATSPTFGWASSASQKNEYLQQCTEMKYLDLDWWPVRIMVHAAVSAIVWNCVNSNENCHFLLVMLSCLRIWVKHHSDTECTWQWHITVTQNTHNSETPQWHRIHTTVKHHSDTECTWQWHITVTQNTHDSETSQWHRIHTAVTHHSGTEYTRQWHITVAQNTHDSETLQWHRIHTAVTHHSDTEYTRQWHITVAQNTHDTVTLKS
jgi:hypothetical protein